MNEYERLIQIIAWDNGSLTKDMYYSMIVKVKDQILLDIAKTGQVHVAKKLNMTQPRLSAIACILRVLP